MAHLLYGLYEDKCLHSDLNQQPTFTAKKTGLYKDALTRKVTKAVKINDTPNPNLINTTAEFGHNKLTRLQLTTEIISATTPLHKSV